MESIDDRQRGLVAEDTDERQESREERAGRPDEGDQRLDYIVGITMSM